MLPEKLNSANFVELGGSMRIMTVDINQKILWVWFILVPFYFSPLILTLCHLKTRPLTIMSVTATNSLNISNPIYV